MADCGKPMLRWDSDEWQNGARGKTGDCTTTPPRTEANSGQHQPNMHFGSCQLEDEGQHRAAATALSDNEYEPTLVEQVMAMQNKVQLALNALQGPGEEASTPPRGCTAALGPVTPAPTGWVRSADLSPQLERLQNLEAENKRLREMWRVHAHGNHQREIGWLQAQCSYMQLHGLDCLTEEDMGELVDLLTRAVQRVRLAMQRQGPACGRASQSSVQGRKRDSTKESLESLRSRLDRVRQRGCINSQ